MTEFTLDIVGAFGLIAGDALLFCMVVFLSLSTLAALVNAIQIFRQ